MDWQAEAGHLPEEMLFGRCSYQLHEKLWLKWNCSMPHFHLVHQLERVADFFKLEKEAEHLTVCTKFSFSILQGKVRYELFGARRQSETVTFHVPFVLQLFPVRCWHPRG